MEEMTEAQPRLPRGHAGRVVNLCFHGVGRPGRELESAEERHWISESFFRGVLDLVVGRTDVRLSFDDGNASDVLIGLTALQDRALTASFFPLAARLGQPGSLDRDALRELVSAGMTVGSHGMLHQPWRGMDDERLESELTLARSMLAEAAGSAITTVACPFGSYDRKVVRRLHQLGYTVMYTSDRASAQPGSWRQPRFSVRAPDDLPSIRQILAAPRGSRSELRPLLSMTYKRWR